MGDGLFSLMSSIDDLRARSKNTTLRFAFWAILDAWPTPVARWISMTLASLMKRAKLREKSSSSFGLIVQLRVVEVVDEVLAKHLRKEVGEHASLFLGTEAAHAVAPHLQFLHLALVGQGA